MTLSLHYSPSVFICTPAPPSPVPFPCGDRERQTLLFTHGSRGFWLPISKPVWVNIWYIPWTNYLSERTLSLLSNPPSLSVRFPSRQAPPGRQCALTHRRDISQSLPSPPGISAGRHLLTLMRVPQTYQRAKGQQGPALPVCRHAWLGLGAAGLVQVATLMRSIMSVRPAVIIWLHSIQDTGVFNAV